MKDKSKGSQYKCSQVFGYKGSNQKIHQEDIISVLKFSQDGSHLALGDKAGRIIIFKGTESKKKDDRYSYYTEVYPNLSQFQAYNREFDPLNSSDIDEEVLALSWMKPQGQYQKMLTMNSKYLKLWKIYEKAEKKIIRSANKQLSLPKFQAL